MTRRTRLEKSIAALFSLLLFNLIMLTPGVSAAGVSGTPVHSDPWTSRNALESTIHDQERRRKSRRSAPSLENSRAGLEEQASREIRETFGEDFSRQLEEESEIVRGLHEHKARIGREAGCPPTSPLSSSSPSSLSSLGSLGMMGGLDEDSEGL